MDASALLAAVVAGTDDAVIATDAAGIVTYWGGAAERIYGWTADEAIGTTMARTVPATRAGEERRLLARLLEGERIGHHRTERLHRDGRVLWVSLSLMPIVDDERVIGAVAVVRDLGGAANVELAAELLDSAPDAMVVADRDGVIVLANQQAHALFRYARGELLGARIEDLVPSRLRERHRAHRRGFGEAPVLRPMGTAAQELIAVRGDGSEFPVEISLSPLSSWRGPLVSAAIRDATERRAAEAALKNALALEREASAQLREVDRLKDDFLATVSHELRTPLSAIGGFAELLVEHGDELGTRREELLRRIAANAAEMQSMVEQLLDYSRLTAGRVAVEPVELPLQEALAGVLASHERALAEHRLEVEVTDPDAVVRVDRIGFARVVGNFLTNATKFSPAGSTVTVRASRISDGRHVRVSVTDQGVGIAPEHLDTVFERFFQVGELTVRGAGIGLSIATRYAELHGGRVEVESEPGRGSTFSFVLPALTPRRP